MFGNRVKRIAINFLLITDKQDLSVTAKREPARVLSIQKQAAYEQGRIDALRWNSLAGKSVSHTAYADGALVVGG
jgi:hypothetical protein